MNRGPGGGSPRTIDGMRLGINIRKLIDFRRAGVDEVKVNAWPWRHPGAPYYIVNRLTNDDGHGDYTRLYSFDGDGVPFVIRAGRPWYEALNVARYALRMLHIAEACGDPDAKLKARRQIPALVASSAGSGSWSAGPASGRMADGRPSAIVQGVVLSAMIRLHRDTPEDVPMPVIERGFEVLATPVPDGGVLSRLGSGPFLEEYPSEPPSHVLNGCMYALFALYDLADAIGHRGAARLAAAVEGTLARELGLFVTRSGWSRYALGLNGHPSLASIHYHRHHVCMTRIVAERTGDPRIAEISDRWSNALHSARARVFHAVGKGLDVLGCRRTAPSTNPAA